MPKLISASPLPLLYALGASALLTNTVGRFEGALRTTAWLSGAIIAIALIGALLGFGLKVDRELGRKWSALYWVTICSQAFWAWFKSPLDVDGLFYHLPIVLEALDKNRWGHWELPLWHVRNTPKLGEIPNLAMIALGKSSGWRLAQLGQFATAMLGVCSARELGKAMGFKRTTMYALTLLWSPIFIKQMGSHYVDMSSWSYWLGSAWAVTSGSLWGFAVGVFMHSGVKISGPLTAFPLFVLLFWAHRAGGFGSPISVERLRKFAAIGIVAVILSAMTWMPANWSVHGNPVYPLRVDAIARGDFKSLVPTEMGVGTDAKAIPGTTSWPSVLRPLAIWLVPEVIAVYDQTGSPWGWTGALLVLLALAGLFRSRSGWIPSGAPRALIFSLLLMFVLMPGREIPRHGFLGGWALLTWAWWYFEKRWWTFSWARHSVVAALVLQAIYVCPDRVITRGVQASLGVNGSLSVIRENFMDVLAHGEPQHPDRWFHSPSLPILRRNEPRDAVIDDQEMDLLAAYWGRRFSNRVRLGSGYCRWPYCTEGQ